MVIRTFIFFAHNYYLIGVGEMQSWREDFGLESQCVKCNNDRILKAQRMWNKVIENNALLKHNKNDNDLDEVDKISTLGGDNDKTPNRDIVMVIRRTESDHE